jgi:hypothetical protein
MLPVKIAMKIVSALDISCFNVYLPDIYLPAARAKSLVYHHNQPLSHVIPLATASELIGNIPQKAFTNIY